MATNEVKKDFTQTVYDDELRADMRRIVELAIREDSRELGDLTSLALIPQDARGRAAVVSRERGVVAGLVFAQELLELVDPELNWEGAVEDGAVVDKGARLGIVSGPILSMLTAERLLLNLVGREGANLRHAEDDARLASHGKIRGAVRWRAQSPHGSLRRDFDQRQPYRVRRRFRLRTGGSGASRASLFGNAISRSSPSDA